MLYHNHNCFLLSEAYLAMFRLSPPTVADELALYKFPEVLEFSNPLGGRLPLSSRIRIIWSLRLLISNF